MKNQNESIAPEIVENLAHLFYVYSPGEIGHYIRKLLICFAVNEKDEPDYHDDLINTVDLLMDFLELADSYGVDTDTDKAHLKKHLISDKNEKIELSTSTFKNESIEVIRDFIVRLIEPEKIFYIQSEETIQQDHQPFYDFIVIVPDNYQRSFKEYETLLNLIHTKTANISFTLHKTSTINKQIEDGHLFYSSICNAEHLVYSDNSDQLTTVDATTLTRRRVEAEKKFEIYYKKALSFFEGGKFYIKQDDTAVAAFMLQQAVELTLRGLLKSFLGVDVRTHSIPALIKNLRGFFPELTYLFIVQTAEDAHWLELLDKAYLNSRYGDLEVNKYHLNSTTLKVEKMFELIQCNLPQ